MVNQTPPQVLQRPRTQALQLTRRVPLRAELVERRHLRRRLWRGDLLRRAPQPAAHVGEDVRHLLLGALPRPRRGVAEMHELPAPVGPEPQRIARDALARLSLDDLTRRGAR